MTATSIVALFPCLSVALQGTHKSLCWMLAMLSAMWCVSKKNPPSPASLSWTNFLLGIGIGVEHPCGYVFASDQSEKPGINKRAQHRWVALATSEVLVFSGPAALTLMTSRYHDRFWIRDSRICATDTLLDVRPNVHGCWTAAADIVWLVSVKIIFAPYGACL